MGVSMALVFSYCLLRAEYISVAFSLAGLQSQAAQPVMGSVMGPVGCLCVVLQTRCSVALSVRLKQGTQRWKSGCHRLHT